MGKREPQAPGIDLVKVIARVAAYHPTEFAEAVDWSFSPKWESPEHRLEWVGVQVTDMLTGWSTGLSETMIEMVCAGADYAAIGTWYLHHFK